MSGEQPGAAQAQINSRKRKDPPNIEFQDLSKDDAHPPSAADLSFLNNIRQAFQTLAEVAEEREILAEKIRTEMDDEEEEEEESEEDKEDKEKKEDNRYLCGTCEQISTPIADSMMVHLNFETKIIQPICPDCQITLPKIMAEEHQAEKQDFEKAQEAWLEKKKNFFQQKKHLNKKDFGAAQKRWCNEEPSEDLREAKHQLVATRNWYRYLQRENKKISDDITCAQEMFQKATREWEEAQRQYKEFQREMASMTLMKLV